MVARKQRLDADERFGRAHGESGALREDAPAWLAQADDHLRLQRLGGLAEGGEFGLYLRAAIGVGVRQPFERLALGGENLIVQAELIGLETCRPGAALGNIDLAF